MQPEGSGKTAHGITRTPDGLAGSEVRDSQFVIAPWNLLDRIQEDPRFKAFLADMEKQSASFTKRCSMGKRGKATGGCSDLHLFVLSPADVAEGWRWSTSDRKNGTATVSAC